MGDTGTVKVGPKGRVVLPVEVRRRFGIEEGTELCVVVGEHGVELYTRDELVAKIQSRFADVKGNLVDELIAERRAEAERDRAEMARDAAHLGKQTRSA